MQKNENRMETGMEGVIYEYGRDHTAAAVRTGSFNL